jgi:hypothetical protein
LLVVTAHVIKLAAHPVEHMTYGFGEPIERQRFAYGPWRWSVTYGKSGLSFRSHPNPGSKMEGWGKPRQ